MNAKEFRGANNRAYYGIYHAISSIHALDGNAYKRHIHRLFEKFGFDELFGRSAVMELLELRGSGVSRKSDCIFQKPEKCFHLTRNNFQRITVLTIFPLFYLLGIQTLESYILIGLLPQCGNNLIVQTVCINCRIQIH